MLTIKPRFVVDNQTGMAIEVKQKGSPDLDADPYYGGERRCSCRLDLNQRQVYYLEGGGGIWQSPEHSNLGWMLHRQTH